VRKILCIAAALWTGAAFFTAPVRADLGFPDYVKLPPQIQINPDQNLIKEDLAEVEFQVDAAGKMVTQRGRHYVRWLDYKPAAGEPAPGYYNGTEGRIYQAIQTVFARGGWQLVYASEDKSYFTLRLKKDGTDTWAKVKMDAPQAQVNLEIIEVGSAANKLVLPPPAAQPEKFGDNADIPYLPPYPGSTRKGGGRSDGPLEVTEPGKAGGEPLLVGTGVVARSYQGPSTLSQLQFVAEYRSALTQAGWKVVYPTDATAANAAAVIGHYTKNGRDIWARIFYEYGASVAYSVADVGAEDWAARFDKDCHLPLYGVFFDFNQSTLKPESEPVLTKVANLLKAKPSVGVELQGHTDNVGGDDSNLKLSNARAASVKQWLTQHGIAGDRLAAKGYGKTQPVTGNDSAEGRARNRRVELVKVGCKASR
jgi:outer membrane protein OmpA-like peptidoglycan-associated protein